MYKQLTFLDHSLPELERRLEKVEASSNAVRKGIHVRHCELKKLYDELKWEFETLKMAICKGEKHG